MLEVNQISHKCVIIVFTLMCHSDSWEGIIQFFEIANLPSFKRLNRKKKKIPAFYIHWWVHHNISYHCNSNLDTGLSMDFHPLIFLWWHNLKLRAHHLESLEWPQTLLIVVLEIMNICNNIKKYKFFKSFNLLEIILTGIK